MYARLKIFLSDDNEYRFLSIVRDELEWGSHPQDDRLLAVDQLRRFTLAIRVGHADLLKFSLFLLLCVFCCAVLSQKSDALAALFTDFEGFTNIKAWITTRRCFLSIGYGDNLERGADSASVFGEVAHLEFGESITLFVFEASMPTSSCAIEYNKPSSINVM